MSDCATLEVGKCKIAMSPHSGLLNGELFAKRNAVVVREHGVTPDSALPETKGVSEPAMSAPTCPGRGTSSSVPSLTWSWYLALLAASHFSTAPPDAFAPFLYAAHRALIASLDALPDLILTRWLNTLLRRLFLGVKGTTVRRSWVGW